MNRCSSKRRFQRLFTKIIGLLVVIGLFWFGTVSYLATPRGEIQQIRWELNRLGEIVGNDWAAGEIAIAIAKDGNLRRAQEVIDSKIDSSYSKAPALSAIAEAISKLNEPEKGIELLQQALSSANQIDSSYDKASALSAIAEAYGQLNEPQQASKLLEQALTAANQIDSSSDKASALSAISKVHAELENWGEARRVSNRITIQDEKAKSLAQVLNTWNEKQKKVKSQKSRQAG